MSFSNIPTIKVGIVAVSRDCFPAPLAVNRRKALVEAYTKKYGAADIYECPITIVESEIDMVNALEDIKKADCNALCVYLGNFGPEIAETLLAKHFDGPKMFCAAAEESQGTLGVQGRGDAYCGMLNASYNLALRNTKAYIPEYPVGDAGDCADMIHDFLPVARVAVGLSNLKIISFGPRPQNFLACNAPIKQLYNLGVEIEEESELDLFEAYQKHEGDSRIAAVVEDMKKELGDNKMLPKLAQYELTLTDWMEEHKGYRKYVALTTKCWPAFQDMFRFVPCYVNSRLTGRGIPVSCEVDIYGTLSEYIGLCITGEPVTLLDINNSVPKDMYEQHIKGKFDYKHTDTFMGFHCGNTCSSKIHGAHLDYQKIMANTHPAEWCEGTIEGDINPGDITFYRLQSTADCQLRAYDAEGEVLPVATQSFGGIGVFAIKEMGRFYRYELIGKNYPHHGAVMFGHYGKALYDALKYIGVDPANIGYNHPAGDRYVDENPFA
ncbi:MAG: fucose isomerase [Lachnospiraceae bacterium]|jgi:L-fucose isomerase-like protein|nr:fucose isomerase [Lachnospiraceae bacterium]MDD4524537.1 fucose isomerase [Lachnospiraceae bacterium]